jgi:hypothetical protein
VNIPHVRVELVLSWERTASPEETLAATAASDHAPEPLGLLVDGFTVTTLVSPPREGLRAIGPIAADFLAWRALFPSAE